MNQPIATRAVHLDLKGLPPTPARLMRLLELFAAAGFNAVLVEWEDAFPWTVDERFRSETAYSPGTVDEFHRRARELGLQIIPLVQSLGHMETPLRLPEYAALREVPGRCDGLNPLAPGARELVARMIDDVLRHSPDVTHFHLGGDEAMTFGTHPQTRAFVAQHGAAALYLHHVEPLLDQLLSRGIRPILWHDMMWDWDEAPLRRLGAKADLMAWTYQGHPDHAPPKHNTAVIERFRAAGVTLWGAAASKGADGADRDLPDLEKRIANVLAWSDLVRRFPLRGVVATAWSRYTTHRVQCEPIDGALDAVFHVGHVLNRGERAGDGAIAEQLRSISEFERFAACRDALAKLAAARREAWQAILMCREQIATEGMDRRRRGSGVLDVLEQLSGERLAAVESAAGDVRRALATLVDELWIDRYLAERIEPLRRALATR